MGRSGALHSSPRCTRRCGRDGLPKGCGGSCGCRAGSWPRSFLRKGAFGGCARCVGRGSSRFGGHARLLGQVNPPQQGRPLVLEARDPLGQGGDLLEIVRVGGHHRGGRGQVVVLRILDPRLQAGGLPIDESVEERPLLTKLFLGVTRDRAHRTRATRLTPSRAASAVVSASVDICGSTSAWGRSNAMSAAKRRGRESGSGRSTNAGAFP